MLNSTTALKCLIIVILFADLNSSEPINNTSNKSNLSEWIEYKSQAGLQYKNLVDNVSNESQRIKIFTDNMKHIKAHNLEPSKSRTLNNKRPTYVMGPNHLAHLTLDEINARYRSQMNMSEIEHSAKFLYQKNNGSSEAASSSCGNNSTRSKRQVSVADSVDWAARGYLSPVTDQGGCGSCYAFSAAWAVESAYAIKYNVRYHVNHFSKQQLVDCTFYTEKDDNNIVYNNLGCMGGNIYRTLLYIFNNGLELEADYPYVANKKVAQQNGQVQKCRYDTNKFSLKINNYYGINFRNVEEMKRVVSRQPVIAYFSVTNEFYFYRSGIFSTSECGRDNCERVNHSVLIVGYGVENEVGYWLVKNSWGPNWGENGYFRIEMNSNMCCVEGYSMYPYL